MGDLLRRVQNKGSGVSALHSVYEPSIMQPAWVEMTAVVGCGTMKGRENLEGLRSLHDSAAGMAIKMSNLRFYERRSLLICAGSS